MTNESSPSPDKTELSNPERRPVYPLFQELSRTEGWGLLCRLVERYLKACAAPKAPGAYKEYAVERAYADGQAAMWLWMQDMVKLLSNSERERKIMEKLEAGNRGAAPHDLMRRIVEESLASVTRGEDGHDA